MKNYVPDVMIYQHDRQNAITEQLNGELGCCVVS